MKRLILLPLLLAGCATNRHPVPIIQTVYCLTPDQYKVLVDAEPPKIGNALDPDARKANQQETRQNILVRLYADGLLNVLGHCVGQAK